MLIDRTDRMKKWVPPIKQMLTRGLRVYVYFNSHHAGYAPGAVELFEKMITDELEGREGKAQGFPVNA